MNAQILEATLSFVQHINDIILTGSLVCGHLSIGGGYRIR